MNSRHNIVPAIAGYDLVEGVEDETGNIVELAYVPVVAWAIEEAQSSSTGWPIGLGLQVKPTIKSFVRTPKGQFYTLEGDIYEDEQSVLEELRELKKRRA